MFSSAPSQLLALARKAAASQSLDPALVCAVVEQESNWNPWAVRYEPAFFSKYVAPLYTAGKISATEAYARGMSWGLCISAGELVSTEEGWQPIKSIIPGMRVLNRQGMLSTVRAVVEKPPTRCLEIALALNPPLRMTPDHRVFARKAALSKWHTGRTRVLYETHPDYIAASDLSPWDQIAFPRSSPSSAVDGIDVTEYLASPSGAHNPIEYVVNREWLIITYKGGRERCRIRRHIPITKEFLELIGLYVAEGNRLEKGKGCAFSFHKNETYLHSRVIELASIVFGEAPREGIGGHGNGVQIFLYGPGARLLTELVPGTAKTKKLPGWLLFLPPTMQKHLFVGAFLGDGCRKYAKLTTASPSVAYGMAHILLRLGIVPRLSIATSGERSWFDVSANSHAAVANLNSQLGDLLEWVQTSQFGLRRKNATHWDEDSDFIYFPVRRVTPIKARPVFDLDAGEDSSFCIGRSVVHNCQVMGQVARETGFDAPFLSALCDPEQGLSIGCKVLRKKFDAMAGNLTRALLAWNGGGNPNYAAQVLARRPHYL